MQPLSIWTHVEILNDRRVERTRRHKLMDILVVSVMAVVCLANGWDDIEEFATLREAWPRTLLELANGIPSADTFGREFTALDPGSRCHLGIERQTVTVAATSPSRTTSSRVERARLPLLAPGTRRLLVGGVDNEAVNGVWRLRVSRSERVFQARR